ncbi:MAG TPA: helix-turn-helix transcriptional regulator [Anaerolineae bacterium]|nr:helix-turn-helix transcriptional regulator [Anaerolineae bacterium]
MNPIVGYVITGILIITFLIFLFKAQWNGNLPDEQEAEPTQSRYRLVGTPQMNRTTRSERWASLTLRERAVANLAIENKSNEQIAHELNISRRTVETHLKNIYFKLGIHSRGALRWMRDSAEAHPDIEPPPPEDTT